MKAKYHYILLLVSLLIAGLCGVLLPHINVNSDMTKYLPNDSKMRKGLEIVTDEFNATDFQTADVKAMFHGLSGDSVALIADELDSIDNVAAVTYQYSADSAYVLYNLVVPKSVDQKAMGKSIREDYGKEVIVETSQDGATPPFAVIVISAVLIFLILFLMAESWLDPLLILISTGIAVIINVGTNALLPSVSITTNYIAPILQLVLSLDYSIVLMNRYRQECNDERTPCESINAAMYRAFPSIMSSALTTVVGLLMLLFMRLKIGMDMGIVLAKGVICSLICTFTVLPSLLLIFTKALQKTTKRVFVLPTNSLGWFVTHHKVTLVIFLVVLFGTSWWLSRKTEITFSTNGESQIAKVFPKMNPVIVVFDTQDEMNVIDLADSLKGAPYLQAVISYPTLLKEPYTAPELTQHIAELVEDMHDYMPEIENVDKLTPEVMQMVYYLHSGEGDSLQIEFPELMRFIREDCLNNPMFAGVIDERMKAQIQLLDGILAMEQEDEEEEPEEVMAQEEPTGAQEVLNVSSEQTPQQPAEEVVQPEEQKQEETVAPQQPAPTKRQQKQQTKAQPTKPIIKDGKVNVIQFVAKLHELYNNDESFYLYNVTDTTRLHYEMSVKQMANYIGSSPSQTKIVYGMADGAKRMTPLKYVHFLTDDLFQRKALQGMVSADQKSSLIIRVRFMDYANEDAYITPEELAGRLTEYGFSGMDEARILAIAGSTEPASAPEPEDDTEIPVEPIEDPQTDLADYSTLPLGSDSVASGSTEVTKTPEQTAATTTVTTPVRITKQPAKPKPKPREKTEEELKAELMMELMSSGKKYNAEEMAENFTNLGESIDTGTVSLLYSFYGSQKQYDTTLVMSCEELLIYVADTLVKDERIASFLDAKSREMIALIPQELSAGIGKLSHDDWSMLILITDLPDETPDTYAFVDRLDSLCTAMLENEYYLVGEPVMFNEMKHGFGAEMTRITLLTVLAIFLIIAISFKSVVVPTILVMTVMTAVYVNVIFSGIVSGGMLYLAYLIVQSILMGATIDYGILFTNYYKEYRKTADEYEASKAAYRGSIRTIMTSGLIMVFGPGAMALLLDDVAISAIVSCLSIGSAVAIILILCVLPGLLVFFDRWVVKRSNSYGY